MAFSKEQLLLLNNLIYEVSKDEFNTGNKLWTVADLIGNQRFSELAEGKNVPDMATGRDWKNLIQAVKNDPKIMNLRIREYHVDNAKGGGGGRSMVLTDESTKEAIVLFRGTFDEEWKDNFIGGNVTDTQQQENALAWYREVCEIHNLDQYDVTVTGHSKGGNKSKYITVMDDSVDHCVSFDGQGFSDKFMDKYSERIAARQDKIENHNVDYDYVNLLLNDIGRTTYYKGQDVGDGGGGFLENHHPVSYFKWDENGGLSMEESPDGQPAEMKAIDEFLNSCLRSLPDQDRDKMLLMVYNMVMCGFSLRDNGTEKMMSDLNQMLKDSETRESLPYLLAYFIRYERENPEVARLIREFMKKSGREDLCRIVDIVEQILNEGIKIDIDLPFNNKVTITITFEQLVDIAGKAGEVALLGNKISGGRLLEKARQAIKEKYGIDLTKENLEGILQMIPAVRTDMDRIRVEKDSSDRKIPSEKSESSKKASGSSSSGGHHQFRVEPEKIRNVVAQFSALINDLHQCSGEITGAGEKIRFMTANTPAIRAATARAAENMGKIESSTKKMSRSLDEILKLYETTESGLCG